MIDIPIDRSTDAYRARIRELAQTKRQPRPDRKHRDRASPGRAAPDRAAPGRRPYPWTVDSVDIGTSDD